MELWFLFTLIATGAAGFHFFFQKVVAERGYDAALANMYGALLSALILAIATWMLADFQHLTWYLVGLVVVSGGLFALNAVMRVEALRCIDTAIYLPLYKTLGPMIAIVIGVIFFNERFSSIEWFGLGLSLLVPLLLISRVEKLRQKNLMRGLFWLVITAFVSSLYAAVDKLAADTVLNVLLYATLADLAGALTSMMLYTYRKGVRHVKREVKSETTRPLLLIALASGITQALGYSMIIFAYVYGGALGIVYTIHSLYILIPIVLAAIIYHEHWNLRKALAVVLSIAALFFLHS